MDLTACDLDGKHGGGLAVLGDLVGSDAEVNAQGLVVNNRTVGLNVSGLEEVALDNLVAASRCAVFDVVLDGVSLLGQVGDLSQECAESVNCCWGSDDCCHGSLSFVT